jgi:hypothetical protein
MPRTTFTQLLFLESAWHWRQLRIAWRAWRVARRTGLALEDARAMVRLGRTDREIDALLQGRHDAP